MAASTTIPIDNHIVRQALRSLDSEWSLGQSPLMGLACVAALAAEQDAPPVTALHRLLLGAIDRIAASTDGGDVARRDRLAHEVVIGHYIEGRTITELEARLSVSHAEISRRATVGMNRLVRILLGMERDALEAAAESAAATRMFSPPRRTCDHMVGRQDLIASISNWLAYGRGNVLALYGPAGIGKSALAREIAHDETVMSQFADGTCVFELGSNPTRVRGLIEFCAVAAGASHEAVAKLPTVEAVARAAREQLQGARVLFVLDDVCDVADYRAFDILAPGCAMIVTTRTPRLALQIAGRHAIQVSELTRDHSLDLLAWYVPEISNLGPDEADRLAERLGGLPVALVVAAHHLLSIAQRGDPHRTLAAMRELIGRGHGDAARPRGMPSGTDVLASIFETSAGRLPHGAQKLLTAMAVFAPRPVTISEQNLLDIADAEIDDIEALVDGGFLIPMAADRYAIHQSFHEIAVAKLRRSPDAPRLWRRMVEAMGAFVRERRTDFVAIEPEHGLVMRAIDIAREQRMAPEFMRLALDIAPFMRARRMTPATELLLNEAWLAARDSRDGPMQAKIAVELCYIAASGGSDDDAYHWSREVIDCPDQSLVADHLPYALEVQSVIAQRRGDLDAAVDFAKRSVERSRHARHGGVFDRQMTYESLAAEDIARITGGNADKGRVIALWKQALRSYLRDGDMPAADRTTREALALARTLDEPLYVVHSLGHLSLGAYTVGNYAEAVAAADEAASLMEHGYAGDTLPTRGFAFSTAYGRISQTLFGQYSEAVARIEESIEFGKRTHSVEHLAFCYHGLAACHHHAGEHERAYVAAQLSLAYAQQSGSRDTVGSPIRACGYTAVALDRVEEGIGYLLEARKTAFEVWTPYYVDIELGIAHLRAGRHGLAEPLLRTASDVLHRRGAEQFAIKADFALARVLAATGRGAEARALGEATLAHCRQLHDIRARAVAEWLAAL